MSRGILRKPILYLSDFLERNRTHYYDNLMRTREKNDINQWLKFFLVGMIETAKSGIETFDTILRLQKKVEEKIQTLGSRAANAQKVVNQLFHKPIVNAEKVAGIADISVPSAYLMIRELERLDIIKEITGGKRKKVYLFDDYLQIFK